MTLVLDWSPATQRQPAVNSIPVQRKKLACPSWCTEGDRHFEDGYHAATLGSATVVAELKDENGVFPEITLTVTAGCLPGEEPVILVSHDGVGGFEGSADHIEELSRVLGDAADAIRGGDSPIPAYPAIVEPSHVAELSEGQEAADEAADALELIVGHLVETCSGEDPLDVAVLLYPADVRLLLQLAGVQ